MRCFSLCKGFKYLWVIVDQSWGIQVPLSVFVLFLSWITSVDVEHFYKKKRTAFVSFVRIIYFDNLFGKAFLFYLNLPEVQADVPALQNENYYMWQPQRCICILIHILLSFFFFFEENSTFYTRINFLFSGPQQLIKLSRRLQTKCQCPS